MGPSRPRSQTACDQWGEMGPGVHKLRRSSGCQAGPLPCRAIFRHIMRPWFAAPPPFSAGIERAGYCALAALENSGSCSHPAAPPAPAFVHIARQKADEWLRFAGNRLASGSTPPTSGATHWASEEAISIPQDPDSPPLLPGACANVESGG